MQPSYNISALKASVYSIKTLQLADLIDVHKRLAENEKLQFVLQITIQIQELKLQKEVQENVQQTWRNLTTNSPLCMKFVRKNWEIKKQLYKCRQDEIMPYIYHKYGASRRNELYYKFTGKKMPQKNEMTPLSFIEYKLSSLKSSFSQFTRKNDSQLKQQSNQSEKVALLLDTNPVLSHQQVKQKMVKEDFIKTKKLIQCRWTILEYSLQELKQIQAELLKTPSHSEQLTHQVQLRIKQLIFLENLERYCIISLRSQSQVGRVYKNLLQLNQNLKVNQLKQKKAYKQAAQLQENADKNDRPELELEKALREIVIKERYELPKSNKQQAALFDLFKKDQTDIIWALKLCRWKLYFFSLESLIQLKKIISKSKDKEAGQIYAFIGLRIKQLTKKHLDLQIISHVLLISRLTRERKFPIQQFYALKPKN